MDLSRKHATNNIKIETSFGCYQCSSLLILLLQYFNSSTTATAANAANAAAATTTVVQPRNSETGLEPLLPTPGKELTFAGDLNFFLDVIILPLLFFFLLLLCP